MVDLLIDFEQIHIEGLAKRGAYSPGDGHWIKVVEPFCTPEGQPFEK